MGIIQGVYEMKVRCVCQVQFKLLENVCICDDKVALIFITGFFWTVTSIFKTMVQYTWLSMLQKSIQVVLEFLGNLSWAQDSCANFLFEDLLLKAFVCQFLKEDTSLLPQLLMLALKKLCLLSRYILAVWSLSLLDFFCLAQSTKNSPGDIRFGKWNQMCAS